MDRATAIEALTEYFGSAAAPIAAAALFGSVARNAARPDSDLDIAVLLSGTAQAAVVGPLTTIRGDLERRFNREVELLDLRTAPVDVRHRVLREGILLLDRDPAQRIGFEVRTRNEYFDLVPYLEDYRKARTG
jgi:predicted nucleotidyltransferase